MKQKIYVRDGRRFVEVVDPLLRVGCYVDNLGRFLDHRTVHSIGRCVGIRDGYYIIAFFDRDVNFIYDDCVYDNRKLALYKVISCFVPDNLELRKNMYIPEIHELLWTAYEYPELFDKDKDYLSNTLFYDRRSGCHLIRGLCFVSTNQFWDSGYCMSNFSILEVKPFSKIKVYGEED